MRSIADTAWHPAQVLNLSVTGVLLQHDQGYDIGERVEVEIEFLTQTEIKTVVTGVGYVVRKEKAETRCTAIHFDLGCTPTMGAIAPDARDARP